MNKKLIKAEKDMLKLFQSRPNKSFGMNDLIKILNKKKNEESEIRAAFWTLMSQEHLKFNNCLAKLNN